MLFGDRRALRVSDLISTPRSKGNSSPLAASPPRGQILQRAAFFTEVSRNLYSMPQDQIVPAKTILVVDDDTGVRTVVRAMLSGESFAVSQAADGIEALTVMRDQRFDLITDLVMPNMEGSN